MKEQRYEKEKLQSPQPVGAPRLRLLRRWDMLKAGNRPLSGISAGMMVGASVPALAAWTSCRNRRASNTQQSSLL